MNTSSFVAIALEYEIKLVISKQFFWMISFLILMILYTFFECLEVYGTRRIMSSFRLKCHTHFFVFLNGYTNFFVHKYFINILDYYILWRLYDILWWLQSFALPSGSNGFRLKSYSCVSNAITSILHLNSGPVN